MPILNYRDSKWKTYYDVLDAVREFPVAFLGGVNEDWIRGTRMPRLQAFLSALHFAGLDDGEPPFVDFGFWFSVHVDGIDDSHNMPFHWLEERERGGDSAFDFFFARLDEYRACQVAAVERSTGPFAPTFTVGADNPRRPDDPESIVLGRFAPSKVFFWQEVRPAETVRRRPFFRSLAAARKAASQWWGIERTSWSAV